MPPSPSFPSAALSRSPAETQELGRQLGAAAAAGRLGPGDVLGLVGPLGAGKTHFVKGLALGLGLDPARVTSPTFTLLHEYRDPAARCPLYHGDFYRLARPEEALALGLEEVLDGDGVTVIEWADLFPALLPARTRWWHLSPAALDGRGEPDGSTVRHLVRLPVAPAAAGSAARD